MRFIIMLCLSVFTFSLGASVPYAAPTQSLTYEDPLHHLLDAYLRPAAEATLPPYPADAFVTVWEITASDLNLGIQLIGDYNIYWDWENAPTVFE